MTNKLLSGVDGNLQAEFNNYAGNVNINSMAEVQSFLEASTIFIQSEVSMLSNVLNALGVVHEGMILPTGVAAPVVWLDGLPA